MRLYGCLNSYITSPWCIEMEGLLCGVRLSLVHVWCVVVVVVKPHVVVKN